MDKPLKDRIQVVVVGARLDGQAGVVLDAIAEIGGMEIAGFIDNTPELQGKEIAGIPVIGSTDELGNIRFPSEYVHIAIGDNVARGDIGRRLKDMGLKLLTVVHPTATVNRNAVVGEGCYIGPRAIVNNGSVIGGLCIINSGAIVEHDNKIGYSVHVAPGAKTAGRVRIDEYSFVGLGSVVLPDVHIGSGVMVGAGSTVVKDVPSGSTMIGYAAKPHTKNIYVDVEPDVAPPQKTYVAQPTLPDYPLLDARFRNIVESRMLSNFATYSRQFELNAQKLLDVRRALTFPNGTTALMLAMKMLELKGEVIMPSFTFSATGLAALWNGLTPVFADMDSRTFNVDVADVERKITPKTSAIVGVHIFGNPCDVDGLDALAKLHGLKLLFDSAHALGSMYNGMPVGGFGDVECFSLSGTKVITSAEGGVATSNDEAFMKKMDVGRNYGAGSDYECHYAGLNGKMSEFHAAIAVESLLMLKDLVRDRNRIAGLYRERLSELPGIGFQDVPSSHVSTYKDFGVTVDAEKFGMGRDELIDRLNRDGIYPKKYFYPPLHTMPVFRQAGCIAEGLDNTVKIADNIVCLPIYSHMNVDTVEKICFSMYRIWRGTGGR